MGSAARKTYVGIDVAKGHLDVAIRPTGEYLRTSNDEREANHLARRLQREDGVLVVVEATGGLERVLTAALSAAGVAVAVVNPRQVRDRTPWQPPRLPAP